MSLLKSKGVVRRPLEEGNYELPLTKVEELKNSTGEFVQLTFKKDDIELVHRLKESQIRYAREALGNQVGKYGEEIALEDVLILGFVYQIYVSYNEYGRNVSFSANRRVTEDNEDTVEEVSEVL